MTSSNKKGLPLYLIKILTKYSDIDHPLTQQKMIDYLYNDYYLEIERKTIGSTLKFLSDLDYDINKSNDKNKPGYYLGEREIDSSELKFIADALFSSRSISNKSTQQLINKLLLTQSKYIKDSYSYMTTINNLNNNIIAKNNEFNDLFFNIEIINEAINEKKMISFSYGIYNKEKKLVKRYGENYRYNVYPYFLINSQGRYYLLCKYLNENHKSDSLNVFRVDFIEEIIKEEQPLILIDKYVKGFNIHDYISKHIYLFGGDIVEATLLVENEYAVHNIVDWFGQNAYFFDKDNQTYATIKCNENALFYWCLQYGRSIKVISPDSLVNKIKEELNQTIKKYK